MNLLVPIDIDTLECLAAPRIAGKFFAAGAAAAAKHELQLSVAKEVDNWDRFFVDFRHTHSYHRVVVAICCGIHEDLKEDSPRSAPEV
ncbi:MAG: hypothetical protein JW820_05830 [Spirochaetales bacterium]|nr:hypothetical protein [Spirochaetales bacterium]